MTTSQSVVAGVLWIATLGLLALVLLNYRLIDRLYSGASLMKTGGLKPGVEIPPINVVTDHEGGGAALLLPTNGERYLVAFVSVDCDGCRALLSTLAARKEFSGFMAAVVVEGVPYGRRVAPLPEGVPIYVAHAGDRVKRDFGVTVVPLLYVLREGKVLATGAVASEDELRKLLEQADANEEEFGSATEPVVVPGNRRVDATATAEMSPDGG